MDPEDQVVRYADHAGASIAWAAVGDGPPLVIGGWWSSHLELDWRNAGFRRFTSALARHRTVIRYDRPGTGVSDRGGLPARSLEEEFEILEALIDEAAPGRVALFGASSGAGVASLFAARHPDRVDALVLYGAYARGADLAPPAAREAMLGVIDQHWGLGSRVLADLFLPDATAEERAEFVEFQRRSASREVALASLRAVYDFDATGHLGDVLAPTLVLHRRSDRAIPYALGKDLARRIRGSRFVELQGDDHFPWRGDADAVVRATLSFLGAPVEPEPARGGARGDAGGATGARSGSPSARLTDREREVLRLVAMGRTDGEIAARLMLSTHTVHRHIANIRLKLDVPSRTAAAAWALRNEVI
ncbi:alpha/beta fold hydrolase [Agromyces salentinus]|uniref:Alpha/beta fold hydrolase n=1 Tax=Agromyces salentinus TaxID=269421 RepID=A0ABP4YTB1_9MICO|nr:alpha/beta fold hydrolase [Agromyces salentinus]